MYIYNYVCIYIHTYICTVNIHELCSSLDCYCGWPMPHLIPHLQAPSWALALRRMCSSKQPCALLKEDVISLSPQIWDRGAPWLSEFQEPKV